MRRHVFDMFLSSPDFSRNPYSQGVKSFSPHEDFTMHAQPTGAQHNDQDEDSSSDTLGQCQRHLFGVSFSRGKKQR